MTATIPLQANPEHPLSKEQIQHMLAELNTLPPRAPITEAYEWQRFMSLSALEMVASVDHGGSFSELFGNHLPWWLVRNTRFDWNIVYRRMNEMFDALQEPPPREKYYEMLEAIDRKIEQYSPWSLFVALITPRSMENILADALVGMFCPSMQGREATLRQTECAENMQRLVLAMLLYQCEHGKLPDEHWVEQIKPYLGEIPERYFSCSANPSPEGETTYAMILYGDGDTVTGSLDRILIVELAEPIPFDEAVVSAEDVVMSDQHSGGMNVAHSSGAVQYYEIGSADLLHLLGRE